MKTATVFLLALWGMASQPAQAQDEVADHYTSSSTEACLEEAASDTERLGCVGASARICVAQSGDPLLRIVRAVCAVNETKYWQARLDAAVAHLTEAFAESDAMLATDNTTPYPKALAMAEMQIAWQGFMDETCDFEMALWGWGPGSGVQEVECRLRMTGAQALYLESQPDGDF